ncbi:unnamed protein product, partial [Timema podura]|nr:unnamed protein product [Timema podura]
FSCFRKSMAEVHFFFTESQFLNFEKGELFGFIEFLSSTGGLLGLFMGFSFLSVVEALYFVSLRLWCTLVRGKRVASNQSLLLSDSNNARPINRYPYRH